MKSPLPLLLGLLLSAASPGFCQDAPSPSPAPKGAPRIFAAHHSYFLQIPPILTGMAKAGGFGDEAFVGTNMIGGSKSLQHWAIKDEENKAKQALQAGMVDVLILTPIYLPDAGIENFARFGLEHNPALRITVQEFWLPFDEYQPHYYDPPKIPTPKQVDHNAPTVAALKGMHARYFQEMDAEVRRINGTLAKPALFVVPVGQAVIALREKIIAGQAPGLRTQAELFRDALGHPAVPLQVLIAYTHYAVIYRKNPAGLPVPAALGTLKLPPEQADALNRLLQELAWDAVTHHPLSGMQDTSHR